MSLPHPFIIGFSGRKSSGKNTCADQLTERIIDAQLADCSLRPEQIVKCYSYADPMKRMCRKFFGLTMEQCYGTNDQKNSPTMVHWRNFPVPGLMTEEQSSRYMTAREVLQYFGTEILRKMENSAHVRALMSDIDEDFPLFAFVTDVRFPNEVTAIQQRGDGRVIRLTRCIFPSDTHESETSLDPQNYDWNNFDYILDNREMTLWEQNLLLNTLAQKWGIVYDRTAK